MVSINHYGGQDYIVYKDGKAVSGALSKDEAEAYKKELEELERPVSDEEAAIGFQAIKDMLNDPSKEKKSFKTYWDNAQYKLKS
jgi:hypothetical protein